MIVGTVSFPAIGTSGTFHTSTGSGVLFNTNFAPAFSRVSVLSDGVTSRSTIEHDYFVF
jgi:hypothetical protein